MEPYMYISVVIHFSLLMQVHRTDLCLYFKIELRFLQVISRSSLDSTYTVPEIIRCTELQQI